jgi:tagatose-6-phosphate ketose/aldose isomerase
MTAELLGYPRARLQAAQGLATATEIAQQPSLWRAVRETAEIRSAAIRGFVDPLLGRPELRIVLTGAGTSAFAGEILAPSLTSGLHRRVDAVATTDLVSNPGQYFAEDLPTLLVSFARSGDSPESTAATRLADEFLTECHHLVVTCNPEGALARQHAASTRSLVLTMPAGANDTGFAMTSSFTCMTLSVLLALAPGLLTGDAVERLAEAAEHLLVEGTDLATAVTGRGYGRIVYLGSGPLRGLAQESALKMLELTAGRVATWFDSPLGFRHGPKAVIDERTLILVFISGDPYTSRYDWDIVTELRALVRSENVIAVTGGGASGGVDGPGAPHRLDDLDDAARAIRLVVIAQILALHHSLGLGLTPDNPFPSGAVNRVVEGVTIHQPARRD